MTAGQARQLLGVPLGANAEAIASAYRAAVKAAHPDRGGDAEHLRQVIDAHKVLTSLARAKLAFAPVRRPAEPAARAPVPVRLEITLAEAVQGGARRIETAPGRVVEVKLPAGLSPGEVLRLGGAGPGGLDVLARVTVAGHSGLVLRGRSLFAEIAACAETLMAGEKLEIDTPRGRLAFVAPAGATDGTLVRLKGQGLPARGKRPAGDLIVRLVIQSATDDRPSQRLLRRFSARWAA